MPDNEGRRTERGALQDVWLGRIVSVKIFFGNRQNEAQIKGAAVLDLAQSRQSFIHYRIDADCRLVGAPRIEQRPTYRDSWHVIFSLANLQQSQAFAGRIRLYTALNARHSARRR